MLHELDFDGQYRPRQVHQKPDAYQAYFTQKFRG